MNPDEMADKLTEQILYKVLDRAYPIGKLFWIQDDDRDPNVILGFGQWEQKKDVFILAAGDTYAAGSSGGSATHYHDAGNNLGAPFSLSGSSTWVKRGSNANIPSVTASNQQTGVTWGGGGGTTINTYLLILGYTAVASSLPPYETAYCWKRIA